MVISRIHVGKNTEWFASFVSGVVSMNYPIYPNPTIYRPILNAAAKPGRISHLDTTRRKSQSLASINGYMTANLLKRDAKFRAVDKFWDAEEMFAEKGFLAKNR